VTIFTLVQRGLLRLSGVHSSFATIGGHRIHYLDGGQGPPLVLLHGHPSRALEWTPLLRSLMKGHRIVAPDFLGYGESDAPDIQYAIPEQSAMVMDLLDSLRLAQVDLLGFSMGGWVALTLTRDHPERVRRLVLVGGGGLRFPTNVTPAFFVPTSLEQFRAIEQAQSGRRTPDFLARDLIRTSEARAWALLRSGTSLLSFRGALDGHLATIETPTLLIWGEGDRLIPYDVGQRMAHELPHARLVRLPGCGHLVLWECRDRALPEALNFLQ